MNWSDQRFTRVPWLAQADLEEGARPCWEIAYERDRDIASCWKVIDPFVMEREMFLVLHAIRGNGNDGGDIRLAISHSPRYDVYAQDSFRLAHVHQSNPRRQGDGDDGA